MTIALLLPRFVASTVFLIAFCSFGCNSGSLKDIPFKSDLSQPFDLRYGSTVAIPSENLTIRFDKVTEGRCPADVQCIQAGVGVVSLTVTKNSQSENLVLTAKGLCPQETNCGEEKIVLNYVIKLVNLYPFPGKMLEDKEKYYAKMVISNLGSTENMR